MADFYTFGEVLKVLQSNSQELNKWIETGELRPTIHEGDLKFRGSDVERILASKQRYNWNQVLNALQIETPELQNLINEGTFQVYNDNGKITFDRQEIDQYIALRQIDATIVMASDSDVSLVDDEYDDDFNFSTRRDSKPDYSLDPLMDNFRAANQSKDVYTLDGALSMLQMDEAELEAMIADGEVSVFHNAQGMPEFLKSEIDAIRSERMVDATMVVEAASSGHKQKLAIPQDMMSNVYTSATSLKSDPSSEIEYLSFDEALYELQITPNELKKMIAHQKIEAIPDQGKMKFRKQDVLKYVQKIEPTVILPEEEKDQFAFPEDTISFCDPHTPIAIISPSRSNFQIDFTKLRKSFYPLREVAEILRIPIETLPEILKKYQIRTYHYQGETSLRKADFQKFSDLLEKETEDSSSAIYHAPSSSVSSTMQQDDIAMQGVTTYYTWDEVLQLLNIDSRQLQLMVGRAELQTTKIGNKYYFSKDQVNAKCKTSQSIEPTLIKDTPYISSMPTNQVVVNPYPSRGSSNVPVSPHRSMMPPIPPQSTVPSMQSHRSMVPPIPPRSTVPSMQPHRSMVPPIPPQSTKPPMSFQRSMVPPIPSRVSVPPMPSSIPPISQRPNVPPMQSRTPSIEEETCSLQEAMNILSVSKADIHRFIREKLLTILPNGRLKKKDLLNLQQNKDVDITMVLPLFQDEPEESDDDMVFLRNPVAKSSASKNINIPQPPVNRPIIGHNMPSPVKIQELGMLPPNVYYSALQTSNELQLEQNEIQQLIRKGNLPAYRYQGQLYFRRTDVEEIKKEKMIEPTIMVGGEDVDVIFEDDDDLFI
ncbi:MAG TPA: hypothetical protein PLB63_01085 [Planctomycetota bacterium]|nr:hypothetical protein [Planctomycetota bacterium]HQB01111.1 hypothetical protein [Planctomycetota bacterium]